MTALTAAHGDPLRRGWCAQVRVVYVVLEAQYQSSLSAAVRSLNGKRTDVAYEVRLAAVPRPRSAGH